MGRTIRRVPPNWKHPKDDDGEYRPLYNQSYIEAINEWISNHQLWIQGHHPDQLRIPDVVSKYRYYAEWSGSPPDVELHRPEYGEEATWYQMYETVSEGTPVTPPFASKEELVDYLCNHGTFWHHGKTWTRSAAESFVDSEYMPSLMMIGERMIDQTQETLL